MYRYEELDYNQIMNDSAIDPNSAEAYYALAQCFRLGKGIAPSMEMYQEYLSYAAEEGHEEAVKELEEWNAESVSRTASSVMEASPVVSETTEEVDYESLSVSELRRMADLGNAKAAFRLYSVSKSIGDNKNAVVFLKRAGEHAAQNGVEQKAGREIFLALGEMYKEGPEKNLKESLQAYEMAAELGSSKACVYLSECYRHGNGGVQGKDPEQAERYRRRAAKNGTVGDRYRLAVAYMSENDKLSAFELLEQVLEEAAEGDRYFYLSRIQLGRMGIASYSREDLLEYFWTQGVVSKDTQIAKEAKEELLTLYKAGPEKLSEKCNQVLNDERACQLGIWEKQKGRLPIAKAWFAWCADRNEEAKTALKEMVAQEEAKRIHEEQLAREVAEREAIRKKEEAERERIRKIEEAEREALRKKEAEERARQQAIEAERRRVEEAARAERLRQQQIEAAKIAAERARREQEQREAEEKVWIRNYCNETWTHIILTGVAAGVVIVLALVSHLIEAMISVCELLGSWGTLFWLACAVRATMRYSKIDSLTLTANGKEQLCREMATPRTLIWAVALLWLLGGILTKDTPALLFFGAALGLGFNIVFWTWVMKLLCHWRLHRKIVDWVMARR